MRDFDILAPKKRIAKIGGEEIDVSVMSARVSLKFVTFAEKYNFGTGTLTTADFQPEMLDDMVDIISLICRKSNPKFTADWLLDNLELPILIQVMQYVFEPMLSRMKTLNLDSGTGSGNGEGESGKN